MQKYLYILWCFLSFPIMLRCQSPDKNYVKKTTFRSKISIPYPPTHLRGDVTYIDGLGRLLQNVYEDLSPNSRDIVEAVEYDGFGRLKTTYLPYESQGTASGGIYRMDWKTEQRDFYATLKNENYAYHTNTFEQSPLDRLSVSYGPGSSWLFSAKGIRNYYEISTGATEVRKFNVSSTYAISDGGWFGANELYKNRVEDENGSEVIEYTDKQGRIILKKSRFEDATYASTQYVYNVVGKLCYVIQPEGIFELENEGYSTVSSDDFKEKYTFRYKYDEYNRMTEKQVPGSEPIYMVYDLWHRLILTQDGNQRGQNGISDDKYTFTKFDHLNRPVMTGIVNLAQSLPDIRNDALNYYNYGRYEEKDGTQETGYTTNNTFPSTGPEHCLSVTYYDNYDFPFGDDPNFSFVEELGLTIANDLFISVKGQITGGMTKVLGEDRWVRTLNYYDNKYRLIQSISDDPRGAGFIRLTNTYDFVGNVLKSATTYVNENNEVRIAKEYEYDHADRLLSIYQDVSKNIDLIQANGIDYSSGIVTRNDGINNWGGAGFASTQTIEEGSDGWVEMVAVENNKARMFGLSEHSVNNHYNTIKFAIYPYTSSRLYVFENGANKGQKSTYQAGDVLRVERINGTIYYKKNGEIIYTSTQSWDGELVADASMYHNGSTIKSPRISAVSRVQILKNGYNALEELINKDLHVSTDQAENPSALQSLDYRYNVRGWLKSINSSSLEEVPGINIDDPKPDLFGMELMYSNPLSITPTQ